MENRKPITQQALGKLLARNKIPHFDSERFLRYSSTPTIIAIAISGGGYRAMLAGGGVMCAFDERTPNSTDNLGGLLQATSYIGGISGGSWLVMSSFVNDFVPVYQLKDDENSWSLLNQLLEGVASFDPGPIQNQIQSDYKDPPTVPKVEADEGLFRSVVRIFGLGKKLGAKTLEKKLDANNQEIKVDAKNLESPNSFVLNMFKNIFKQQESNKQKQTSNLEVTSLKDVIKFYKQLLIEVRPKRLSGFHVSFTDYWGRALARRIFNTLGKSPGSTLTDGTRLPSFRTYQQPFPIICAIEKYPNISETSSDSHLFEFTPYEFGSWDSYLNAFVPVKYLGTPLIGGVSTMTTDNPNISVCFSGFDNVCFVTGTSSSLFNHIFVYVYQLLGDCQLVASMAIGTILKKFGLSSEFVSVEDPQVHPDYALYSPNPFYGHNTTDSQGRKISNNPHMYLVDGGDDGQNIPYQPFLAKSRKVDIILVYDITADINNYPNGTTLKKSRERYHNYQSTIDLPIFQLPQKRLQNFQRFFNQSMKYSFPFVPTPEQIERDHLNQKPLFLGCDIEKDYPNVPANSSSISHFNSELPPLIVYNTNQNYSFNSNRSTFQLSYSKDEVDGMIQNGYNMATFMNSTIFGVCLNCAILKREFDRIEYLINRNYLEPFKIPKICVKCFDEFCWSQDPSN
jgi:Lysophospholipase catalytic domain.